MKYSELNIDKSFMIISYIWDKSNNIKIDLENTEEHSIILISEKFKNKWVGTFYYKKIKPKPTFFFNKKYSLNYYYFTDSFLNSFTRLIIIIEFDKIDTFRFINEWKSENRKLFRTKIEENIKIIFGSSFKNSKNDFFNLKYAQIIHNIVIDNKLFVDNRELKLLNNILRRVDNIGTEAERFDEIITVSSDMFFPKSIVINSFSSKLEENKGNEMHYYNYSIFKILDLLSLFYISSYINNDLKQLSFCKYSIKEYISNLENQDDLLKYYKTNVLKDINDASNKQVLYRNLSKKISDEIDSFEQVKLLRQGISELSLILHRIKNNLDNINNDILLIDSKKIMINNSIKDYLNIITNQLNINTNDLNIKLQQKVLILAIISVVISFFSLFSSYKSEILKFINKNEKIHNNKKNEKLDNNHTIPNIDTLKKDTLTKIKKKQTTKNIVHLADSTKIQNNSNK